MADGGQVVRAQHPCAKCKHCTCFIENRVLGRRHLVPRRTNIALNKIASAFSIRHPNFGFTGGIFWGNETLS